jgi:hypothetical protein
MLVLESIRPDKGYHGFSSTEFLMGEIDKTIKVDRPTVLGKFETEWFNSDWFLKYTALSKVLRRMVKQRSIQSVDKNDVYMYQLYPTEVARSRALGSKIPKKVTN